MASGALFTGLGLGARAPGRDTCLREERAEVLQIAMAGLGFRLQGYCLGFRNLGCGALELGLWVWVIQAFVQSKSSLGCAALIRSLQQLEFERTAC